MTRDEFDGDVARLTGRELELLRAMDAYQRPSDIAGQLGISKETVRTHLKNIRRKLDGRDPLSVAAELAAAEGRTPYPVTPDRGMPGERPDEDAPLERLLVGLSEWLPVRRKGHHGNDLTILQRCVWIFIFAVAFSVGFGMLAAGAEAVSNLIDHLR